MGWILDFINWVVLSSKERVIAVEEIVDEKLTKEPTLKVLISIDPSPLSIAVTVELGAIKVVKLDAIETIVFPPTTVWEYDTPPAVIVTTSVAAGFPARVNLITLSVVLVTVEVNATPGTLAVTSIVPKPPTFAAAETLGDPPVIWFASCIAICCLLWSEIPSELRSFVVKA